MAFLVKNRRTGKFLAAPGAWTRLKNSALAFHSPFALAHALALNGESPDDVQIVPIKQPGGC